MKYIKIHKSKFIKFFIVVLVCVFGFFGVNAVVNADSIWEIGTDTSAYIMKSHFNWDSFFAQNSALDAQFICGGNDTLVWFDNYVEGDYAEDDWIFRNSQVNDDTRYSVPRNIYLNTNISNENLLYYNCEISGLNYTDYFIFEKSDFFMRLNDLESNRVPSIKFLQTSCNVIMEISGFILDKNGDTRELHFVNNTRNVARSVEFSFYPTKRELFGGIDLNEIYSSNAIMYISNYRCRIEFPLNHTMSFCNYYYSVQSVEDYNIRYGTIFTDYVNVVSSTDIVGGIADNVNSFLQIEILPGLSFFGILLLAVAVPLLIWILKIFFGG